MVFLFVRRLHSSVVLGPLPSEDVLGMVQRGELRPQDEVSSSSDGSVWIPAWRFPGLFTRSAVVLPVEATHKPEAACVAEQACGSYPAIDEIRALAALHAEGAISLFEFNERKRQLLGISACAPTTAPQQVHTVARGRSSAPQTATGIGCGTIIVLALICAGLSRTCSSSSTPPVGTAATSTPSPAVSISSMIGKTAVVKGATAFAFPSERSLALAEGLYNTGDLEALRQYANSLEQSGRAFEVAAGTNGTILDLSGFGVRTIYKLRFTDGATAGREGWMYVQDIRVLRTPDDTKP